MDRLPEKFHPLPGRRLRRRLGIATALAVVAAGIYFSVGRSDGWRAMAARWRGDGADPSAERPLDLPNDKGMMSLPGGRFVMGGAGDSAAPAHEVELSPFWIDAREVTNADFAAFVEATGYRTRAERLGRSLVFDPIKNDWSEVAGADWRHPLGPASTLIGCQTLPVVHIAWEDAAAYARWAGKQLPTEAQWEFAARGGLLDAEVPWSDETPPNRRANYWQGDFPKEDAQDDGYHGLAPAGHYPSNRFGLFDMAGNAAEWCADGFDADYYTRSAPRDPAGPSVAERRVVRGGSWLSSLENGREYAVWVRRSLPPETTNNFTGFRCAKVVEEKTER